MTESSAMRVAGLMSGTSADGVDAAIVDIVQARLRVLAFHTVPYPPAVRREILKLFRPQTGRVDRLCHLNFVLGELFAEALLKLSRKARIPLRSIDLIGSHGQTVYHIPNGLKRAGGRLRSTLQIGEPCVIAERTGITTVADFRTRDVAAGGQGAPLVPFADLFLFRHPRKHRVIQNIGGIANLTWLPAGGAVSGVIAFDTGPGNMLIDRVAQLASRGRTQFDADGRMAAQGHVLPDLLDKLMSHKYLRRKPPKTTGREQFGTQFSERLYARAIRRGCRPVDLVATVTAFTAKSIAGAYRRFLPDAPDEVILCGGGARNRTLLAMLREELQPARVMLSDELGIDADAKEAISFAILAWATLRGVPNSIPSATGARRRVVLGKIIPGKSRCSKTARN